MGGAEGAVVGVQGDVEAEQIEDHGGPGGHLVIGGEVDEVHEGGHVLVVVDVGVPFGKPDPRAPGKPVEDHGQGLGRVLGSGHAVIGEDLVREELPHEILGRVEEDLVVLGPVAHAVHARLVDPVLKVEHGLPDLLQEGSRQERALGVLVEDPDEGLHAEVATIVALVDEGQVVPDPLLVYRALVELHSGDLGEGVPPGRSDTVLEILLGPGQEGLTHRARIEVPQSRGTDRGRLSCGRGVAGRGKCRKDQQEYDYRQSPYPLGAHKDLLWVNPRVSVNALITLKHKYTFVRKRSKFMSTIVGLIGPVSFPDHILYNPTIF